MRADLTSPEAFADLVREHQSMVFRTLIRLAGKNAPVEDLAQEVFLRLYRALPEFRGEAALSTYLYRIVVNVAQDEWKRRRREQTHIAAQPASDADDSAESWLENMPGDGLASHTRSPEQLMQQADLQCAVDEELLALPEVERAVIVLFHQEERSYEGIATVLQLPVNTVRTHLHRGRKRLADRLKQRMGSGLRLSSASTEEKSGVTEKLSQKFFRRRDSKGRSEEERAEARV